jgi:DNA end-binding protein Ku
MPDNPREKEDGTRASWKGELRIDLVKFPVAAYNVLAPTSGNVRFRQIHVTCHSLIQNQKTCPIHGPVPNQEIVSGYEYETGRYVEFEPEELDQLRTKADKALTIDAFIQPEALDPIYLDGRAFYLVPDGEDAEEPYAVFRAALERTGRWGVGQVVLSEREQLVLLRPINGVLTMEMLRHRDEVRPPDEMHVRALRSSPDNVRLAEELIATAEQPSFDLSAYEDRYRQRVFGAVHSKLEGRPIPAAPQERPPVAASLRDALKRSLEVEQSQS